MNLDSIISQDPQLSCYEQFLFLFFAHTSEEENVSAWRLQFLYYFWNEDESHWINEGQKQEKPVVL